MIKVFKILTLVSLILFAACDDPDAFGCFKKAGNHAIEQRPANSFSHLIIETGVDIAISDENSDVIIVEGPENLLSSIETTFKGDTLYIKDLNSCSWVRSPVPTLIQLPTQPDLFIEYKGYGKIELNSSIQLNNFSLFVEDGMGDINLQFDQVRAVEIFNNSYSNVTLKGKADSLYLEYRRNMGHFDAAGLETKNIHLNFSGKNDVRINPTDKITGLIDGFGNVFSSSRPPIVTVEEKNTGKLIFDN